MTSELESRTLPAAISEPPAPRVGCAGPGADVCSMPHLSWVIVDSLGTPPDLGIAGPWVGPFPGQPGEGSGHRSIPWPPLAPACPCLGGGGWWHQSDGAQASSLSGERNRGLGLPAMDLPGFSGQCVHYPRGHTAGPAHFLHPHPHPQGWGSPTSAFASDLARRQDPACPTQGCLPRAPPIPGPEGNRSSSRGPSPTLPPTVRSASSTEFHPEALWWGWGLDMAPCPQPDSCLAGSPLGLICLSLLLIPAEGASSCPPHPPPLARDPPTSRWGRHTVSWWSLGLGGSPGSPPPVGDRDPLATRVLFLQLEPTASAALASPARPSSPCWRCWLASAPAASSPSSSWHSVSFEPRRA